MTEVMQVEDEIREDRPQRGDMENKVDELTKKNVETIAELQRSFDEQRSAGEKFADIVAAGIGSWPFILIQSFILAVWVLFNVWHILHPWDPYPFILLNLALSFQAAYASPIIMMSQNRQARLDERRNHLDLQINLLAEQENTEILKLLRKLCEAQGIDTGKSTEAFLESTKPVTVVEQIKQFVEKTNG